MGWNYPSGSRMWRGVFLMMAFLNCGLGSVNAGLSEAERTILEQPACAQMKSFSQDITLLDDELQNVRKFGQRNRLCDVLGRATSAVRDTIYYMQSHVGECNITAASFEKMTILGRQLENDRRKTCR